MPNFSQRMGFKPTKALQVASLDQETKIGIWSVLYETVWGKWSRDPSGSDWDQYANDYIDKLYTAIWKANGQASDSRPEFLPYFDRGESLTGSNYVRQIFFLEPWNEVFDSIEFLLEVIKEIDSALSSWDEEIIEGVNKVLEKNNSAYRIVNRKFSEITNGEQIKEIEAALLSPREQVAKHVEKAAAMLWDRERPDYENSIKESISAVESLCKAIVKKDKATLGECLTPLNSLKALHPALKDAISKLYGYASDEGGIRHGKTASSGTVSVTEARFIFVVCSGLVNYLQENYSES